LKSKPKHERGPSSSSRMLETNKNRFNGQSKNKENKSKSKMLQSKGKEIIRSRQKILKT